MVIADTFRVLVLGQSTAPCCGCVIRTIADQMGRGGFTCDCQCHDTAKWLAKR